MRGLRLEFLNVTALPSSPREENPALKIPALLPRSPKTARVLPLPRPTAHSPVMFRNGWYREASLETNAHLIHHRLMAALSVGSERRLGAGVRAARGGKA